MTTRYGYLRDPLFVACLIAYLVNRFWIREVVPPGFWHSYFNDLICIPFWVPLMVTGMRMTGLRKHDDPPRPAEILAPVAQSLKVDPTHRPHVVLVVGVNGSGKTTTIGKLARTYRDAGLRVTLAAGDTFRAAAIEQIRIWGERTGSLVVAKEPGSDAAGLAYEALDRSRNEGSDLLLIDTAGRLHNKAELMAELQKIVRVLKKLDPEAPHDCLLVLDATTGQNAHAQVETFKELVQVSGLMPIRTVMGGSLSGRGGIRLPAPKSAIYLPDFQRVQTQIRKGRPRCR